MVASIYFFEYYLKLNLNVKNQTIKKVIKKIKKF